MGNATLLLPGSHLSCCSRRRLRPPNCNPSIGGSGTALKKPLRQRRLLSSALLRDDGRRQQQQPDPPQLPGKTVGAAVEEMPAEDTNGNELQSMKPDDQQSSLFNFLYPGYFAFSKDLILLFEQPVSSQGVRFLPPSPGEFFFTTLKCLTEVSGYCGLLLGSPVILYEIIAVALPGLTRDERKFLGPIVLGSSVLFYAVLTPAALNFFVNYAEGAVESLWYIDQYFESVLILMFSTGLSFQVPVIQLLLGQVGLVTGDQMLSIWRYVVVGAVVAAAVLTPSTDPQTQILLAGPRLGL